MLGERQRPTAPAEKKKENSVYNLKPTLVILALSFAVINPTSSALLLSSPAKADDAICCLERKPSVELNHEIIARGLDTPWSVAFLSDGSFLVTERAGTLRHVKNGVLSAPFSGLPKIDDNGQGGLLDLALDPDFSNNNTIYFSYSEPSADGKKSGTAVARAQVSLTTKQLTGLETIFTSNIKGRGGRHFGSRIRFAPDKTLYVTLGDRGNPSRAQDPFDHAGSIIRINRDGSIPSDNPAFDGKHALPEIWSIGHRNPQGATIDPVSAALWTTSHGDAGGDEVNKPQIGRNYGWPLISYGKTYSGGGYKLGNSAPGYEQPKYYWDPSIAPSGLTFYDPPNPAIPSWKGSLLAGALRGELLSRLILKSEQVIAEERYFEGEFGRIRDIKVGPDGAVYLLTDGWDGIVVRLTEK